MTSIYSILINTIINSIIPKTEQAVLKGNKIFGAAILLKKDYSLVCTGTNNEIKNPLWHGEIAALNNFFKTSLNKKINTRDCIFLLSQAVRVFTNDVASCNVIPSHFSVIHSAALVASVTSI